MGLMNRRVEESTPSPVRSSVEYTLYLLMSLISLYLFVFALGTYSASTTDEYIAELLFYLSIVGVVFCVNACGAFFSNKPASRMFVVLMAANLLVVGVGASYHWRPIFSYFGLR